MSRSDAGGIKPPLVEANLGTAAAAASSGVVSAPLSIIPATVTTTPLPAQAGPAAPSSATAVPGPAAPTAIVDLSRAEKIAEKYRFLHQLVANDLLPQAQYDSWSQQNAGAFLLLTTASPPLTSARYQAPPYDDLVAFLRSLDALEPSVAEAERGTLMELLMPTDGPREPMAQPPVESQALQTWIALLDRLRDEGLLPSASIEAEKTAIAGAVRNLGFPLR